MLTKYEIMGWVAEDRGGYRLISGDRVQLPPHSDPWMRGARFGVITKVVPGPTPRYGDALVTVRPDALKKSYTFSAREVTRVD